jgi:hypothetical protein
MIKRRLIMAQREMEARMTRLEDIHEIMNLQGRYNHFTAIGNFDAVVDLFAKKDLKVRAEIADSGVYEGIEGVKRLFLKGVESKHGGRGGLGLLMIMTPVIEISREGKTAKGMWHTLGCHTLRHETGPYAVWSQGKYDNEFVKEDGKWKIRSLHWYVNFATPFEEGWVKKPFVGSATQAGFNPDRPSTYHMPYNPDAFNPYLPAPPEPEE